MRSLTTLLLLLCLPHAMAQGNRYITDSLKLESRSGPGVSNRIVRMLDSGTPVRVLESTDGWSRVRLPGGNEAWILDRYLMNDPPARGQLKAARENLETARARTAALQKELQELQSANKELQESRDAFVEQAQSLDTELADIKRTASSTIQIRDDNRRLQDEVQSLSSQLEILKRDFTVVRDSRQRDWFIAGAGVLLGGMVLGLVIPKIRWKRKRGWGEL